MGSPRRVSSLVHDTLGLLALPMTPPGHDPPDDDGPRPGADDAKSSGMAGALVALLVAAGLVALPGPANDVHTSSRTAVWKADHMWCQSALAPFSFASHHPLRELLDPELIVLHLTRSSP